MSLTWQIIMGVLTAIGLFLIYFAIQVAYLTGLTRGRRAGHVDVYREAEANGFVVRNDNGMPTWSPVTSGSIAWPDEDGNIRPRPIKILGKLEKPVNYDEPEFPTAYDNGDDDDEPPTSPIRQFRM